MIPLQLNFSITEFLNISRYENTTVSSIKEIWANDMSANITTFHNVSRQGAEVNCPFSYKENFPIRKHMLCDVLCQHCRIHVQTLAEMTSSPGPSCGQTWLNVLLQALLITSTQTFVATVQWKPQQQHILLFRILADCSKENLPHSHVKR